MPDSEGERITAWVPSCSGANSSSTVIFTFATPLDARLMSLTLPTGRPPTSTWLPFTSWLAFWNVGVTV